MFRLYFLLIAVCVCDTVCAQLTYQVMAICEAVTIDDGISPSGKKSSHSGSRTGWAKSLDSVRYYVNGIHDYETIQSTL